MSRSPRRDTHEEDVAASAAGSSSAAAAAPSNSSGNGQGGFPQRPRLHMTGLPSKWDSLAAKAFFQPVGEVIDCVVFKDGHSGQAKYGFLEFARHESAVSAIEQFDRKPLDDSPALQLQFAKPKGSTSYMAARSNAADPVRLFCANIGSGTTVEQVRAEFERFGRVTDCSVWPNQKASARMDGSRPMSAHIEFASAADAKAAMEALHLRPALRGTEEQQQLAAKEAGQDFHVTPPLIVDFAKPRPDRGGGGGGGDYYRPRDDYYRRGRSRSPPRRRERSRERDDYYRRDRSRERERERERDRDRGRSRSRERREDSYRRSSDSSSRYPDERERDAYRSSRRDERRRSSRSRSPPPPRRRDSRSRSRSPRRR